MAPKKNGYALPRAELPKDRPSQRMLKTWAKRLKRGRATAIPVFVNGKWTVQIPRGHKRVLQLGLGKAEANA